MHSYTPDDMKALLQSLMIDGNLVRRVEFEHMVNRPYTVYRLDIGVGKPLELAVPRMHLDMRTPTKASDQ